MFFRRGRTGPEPEATVVVVPPPRLERVVATLAVQAQQLADRVERLERRVDGFVDAALDAPTHDDLLTVRVHSAKVAAEVARVAVELRAEIERFGRSPGPTTSMPTPTVIDLGRAATG